MNSITQSIERRRLALIAALLVMTAPLVALDVFKFDPAKNLRFRHGSYADGALVENPSFLLVGRDLSGLGWGPGNHGVTLISPQHFVTAAHVAPLPGGTVSFLNRAGLVKHYQVDSVYSVEHRPGVRTDLVVGRLTAAIPPEDQVGFFPTLKLPTPAQYVGLAVYSFGIYQSCGTNIIARAGTYDLLPFNRGDRVKDDILFATDWFHVTGCAQAQGNDSGSPTLVDYNGRLALIGSHSAVDTTREPYSTLDVLIPAYFEPITARLALDGFAFGNVAPGSGRRSP